MRACFLGQNLFTLGFGVATLQAPMPAMDKPAAKPRAEGGQSQSGAKKPLRSLLRAKPRPCSKSATPGG